MNNPFNSSMMITAKGHSQMLNKMAEYKASADYKPETVETDNTVTGDATAILPIYGILGKNVGQEGEEMGMISVDLVSQALDMLAADSSVKNIVLDFACPGGETCGIEELSDKITLIDRDIKPIYAYTSDQMASAAMWIGACCRSIGISKSGECGSVGVYLLTTDCTEQLKQEGIKIEAFVSEKSPYKLMGHEWRSLTEPERAELKLSVEKQDAKFRQVMKLHRPQIQDADLNGLSYEGVEAVNKGYADVVSPTLADFVSLVNKNNTIYSNNDMKIDKVAIKAEAVAVAPVLETKAEAQEVATVKVEVTPTEPEPEKKEDVPGVPGTVSSKCPHCGKSPDDKPDVAPEPEKKEVAEHPEPDGDEKDDKEPVGPEEPDKKALVEAPNRLSAFGFAQPTKRAEGFQAVLSDEMARFANEFISGRKLKQ